MRSFVLAFALGVWLAQQQAALPEGMARLAIAPAIVLFCALLSLLKKSVMVRRRLNEILTVLLRVIAGCALGFFWASVFGHLRLTDALPTAFEGRDIEVIGVVSDLPQAMSRGVRFRFEVESARWPDKPANSPDTANTQSIQIPEHISLAWYRGAPKREDTEEELDATDLPVHVGERWRFVVRLKRPHGNVNPQGLTMKPGCLNAISAPRAMCGRARLSAWRLQPGNLLISRSDCVKPSAPRCRRVCPIALLRGY